MNLSIIVPVYNTEKFLQKCLDSLINQTLKNIEIICINDGSKDNSLEILEEYSKKDERIKIISQENKKQGAARNAGLKIANGEYIGFVDSDDWVDLNYFEILYKKAKENDCDIALADYIRIGKNCQKKRLNINNEEIATNIQDKIDICKQAKHPCPTNKIYKKEMLLKNNIFFPEGMICEDKIFTLKAVYYANKIISVPNVYYYYFKNPNSTVTTKTKKSEDDKKQAQLDVLNFLKEKNIQIKDEIFWATTYEKKILNIPLIKIKESLKTKKIYLFNYFLLLKRKTI